MGYKFVNLALLYHYQKREDITKEIAKRAAPFEERKRGKEQQPKAPLTKGHSDPPDQPEPPPQGWVC